MPSYLPQKINDSNRTRFNERNNKSVINTQYMASVYPIMAGHPTLMAYLEANPVVASQIWYNQAAIKRLKDQPELIDKLEKDPAVEVPKFVRENSQPASPAPKTTARSQSSSSWCTLV